MIKSRFAVFRFICVLSGLSTASAFGWNTLPIVEKSPVIDGVIHAAEWKDALVLEDFVSIKPHEEHTATKSYVVTDGSYLYIAFQCSEPNQKGMVTQTIADEQDGAVWNDDSVEVFLDPGNTGKVYYHLIINSEGTLYDAQVINQRANSAAWSSEAVIRTGRTSEGWEVEIALPLTSVRHLFSGGEIVGLNLARNRHAGGEENLVNSSIAGGHYGVPEHFQRFLVGGALAIPSGGFIVTTQAGPFLQNAKGSWEFEVFSEGEELSEIEFVFTGYGVVEPEKQILDTERTLYSFPFASGEARSRQQCEIRYLQQSLVKYAFETFNPAPTERIARTENPLFESLIEPIPDGLAREGFVLWGHLLPLSRRHIPDLWLRTAVERTNSSVAEWFRDQQAIRLTRSSWYRSVIPGVVEQRELYQDKKVPAIVEIHLAGRIPKGTVPIGPSHSRPWQLDPRVKEAYVGDARYIIEASKEHDDIRMLFAGDETWEVMHRNFIHFLDERDSYPELAAVDEEIREKYGHGKYGLPVSSTDTNPFRWIATRRWEIDQMIDMASEIKDMINQEAPHLKFMSWDNISGHRPYGLHRWGEVFDVITGQLYPARNPDRQVFTFLTHWYHDLTGVKEIWMVPHFENYAANFTKEETEELLSQLYRGGGTGLHLYMADTTGSRRGKASPIEDTAGAPERWAVASYIIEKMLEQPFRVKRPQADTGIFYSNTSYSGQGIGSGRALIYTNEVEWLYTILGPKLKAGIRFIDEGIADRTADVLASLKVVYVPYAPIVDDEEYEALDQFVRNGGILVVCDPLAFRHRSDGSERNVGGIVPLLSSLNSGRPQAMNVTREEIILSATMDSWPLQLPKNGYMLAEYEDGGAGITETSYEKGKVVFFGMNPLTQRSIRDDGWIRIFQQLQTKAETQEASDFWRFRFPSVPVPEPVRPEGVCLTGNYFEWSYNEPKEMFNSREAGRYMISRAPSNVKKRWEEPVDFNTGRLTDRIKGAFAENDALGRDYVLEWRGREPLQIVWKFASGVKAYQARIFYRGALPAGRCEIFVEEDGTWKEVATWEAPDPVIEPGLKMLNISLQGSYGPDFRLNFLPEEEDGWTIAEVEWWGDKY